MDRLGWVVVCGGNRDRLLHPSMWCVSPPFTMGLVFPEWKMLARVEIGADFEYS